MAYEVVEPLSARESGEVSHGQTVTVNVWAQLLAKPQNVQGLQYAAISGWGTITLDEKIFNTYNFGRIDGQNYAPNFSAFGVKYAFTIRAPGQNVPTALLNFKFSKLPQDRNSGLTVAVDADSGIVTLPITVTEKRIQIALIDSLMQGRTFTRSADMYSLFAFKISNVPIPRPFQLTEYSI
jgi:hypothetical protein